MLEGTHWERLKEHCLFLCHIHNSGKYTCSNNTTSRSVLEVADKKNLWAMVCSQYKPVGTPPTQTTWSTYILYVCEWTLHCLQVNRPSNSHGFTMRLMVSGIISRSHSLASKSHGFPSAKSNSCICLHLHVLVPVASFLSTGIVAAVSWDRANRSGPS